MERERDKVTPSTMEEKGNEMAGKKKQKKKGEQKKDL